MHRHTHRQNSRTCTLRMSNEYRWKVIGEYILQSPSPLHMHTHTCAHKYISHTYTQMQHTLGWVCRTELGSSGSILFLIERSNSRRNQEFKSTRLELQVRPKVSWLHFSSWSYVATAQKNQVEISFWKKKNLLRSSCWSRGMALHSIILFKLIWANKYKCACVFTVLKHFNV